MNPDIKPDSSEERGSDAIDDMVPSYGSARTAVVALGGSANSIEALQHFFSAMPPQGGLAFVVLVHLQRDIESSLPQVLQRHTIAADPGSRTPEDRAWEGVCDRPGQAAAVRG